MFLMLDANGRVGSTSSPYVGDAHPETENENGALFHGMLAALDMCAPATFRDHGGPHGAWT